MELVHLGVIGRSSIEPLGLRINDAAQAIGVCRATIYNLAAAGKLRLIHVGGRTIVDYGSLRALFNEEQESEERAS